MERRITFFLLCTLSAAVSAYTGLAFGQTEAGVQYTDLLEKMENSGDFAPMFPFQPTHDAPSNITNVATWPSVSGEMAVRGSVAGAQGFISVEGDHFIDAAGNVRRFLGTNICFTGCFPKKEDAERVAEELTRYGINLVRLHYVHHKFPKDKVYPEHNSFLEPEQLDRFDYLFHCLKEKGIYTYFQLNIARKFGDRNGFPNASRLPFYNNGVDNFEPGMIELQKKYHKDILSHVNPYTGLAYKDDPAIGMLEIANENSIVKSWFNAKHKMPDLVEPYSTHLRMLWNNFLVKKYKTTAAVKKAWSRESGGDGTQYIPEGFFSGAGLDDWGIQLDKVGRGDFELVKACASDKLKGKNFIRIHITRTGVRKNIPQFYRNKLKVRELEPYCLKFKMRASTPMDVVVRLSQNHEPWQLAGMKVTLKCAAEWKEYRINFAGNMDDDLVRLVFSDFQTGTVDIADVSFFSGSDFRIASDQKIEDGTVGWPRPEEWSVPWQRALDFTEFLGTVESEYFGQMYANLKNVVKPSQAIAGTQLRYGFNKIQAEMDYVDAHSYWNHPAFPGRPWDYGNWYLRSVPLVNGDNLPGTNIMDLSKDRILGKPYTISEYDHPNLNFYAAEGYLMLSSVAAFQNWSALMQFAWTHSTDFFRTQLHHTFDLCSATQKLVHLPACYAMFVRGDVKTGDDSITFAETSETVREIKGIALMRDASGANQEKNRLLFHLPMALKSGRQITEMPELFNAEGGRIIRTEDDIPRNIKDQFEAGQVSSSTGEITWNWKEKNYGYFTVDTENTKVFSGFVRGRSFQYKGMLLTPGKTRLDWLTMSLTNTDPAAGMTYESGIRTGTYLLALTGLCHNTDEKIMDIRGGKISCAEKYGGSSGTGPVLCEGIPAKLAFSSLSGKVECYALDQAGCRAERVTVSSNGKDAIVFLGPEYRTVWYELIVR